LSDNTRQYQWIVMIQGGLDALLPDFVGGDLLWYPDPTDDRVRRGPDVMVALGRPKGHRGSYKQWEEDGVAPQVLFEIISPSNSGPKMARKRAFYERHGVQEYYEYDPERNRSRGWVRGGDQLIEIAHLDGWTSPLLGIRFVTRGPELQIFRPDGRPFRTFLQIQTEAEEVEARAEREQQRAEREQQRAEREQQRAEQEHQRAEQEHQRAEQERQRAERADARAAAAGQRAAEEKERAERLAERLRALGVDPDAV